jgi:hypothetical protein
LHQSDQAIIFFQKREMSRHEITFNTNLSEPARTRADFTYKIMPTVISIVDTDLGQPRISKRSCERSNTGIRATPKAKSITLEEAKSRVASEAAVQEQVPEERV